MSDVASNSAVDTTSIKDAPKFDWRLMLPIFIVVGIDAMGNGLITPLLPFYSEHFGTSPVVIGLILAVFSLCQFISAPWLDPIALA